MCQDNILLALFTTLCRRRRAPLLNFKRYSHSINTTCCKGWDNSILLLYFSQYCTSLKTKINMEQGKSNVTIFAKKNYATTCTPHV